MILTKIWERKMFFNILQLSTFFLISIFIIIIIIDFSIHGAKLFAHAQISFSLILKYYINLLIIQLNLLLSFTFMLAMIKILSDMNIHHELTALRMAAISAKMLSRPFAIVAIIFTVTSYLNFQYLYSNALNFKDNFKEQFLKKTTYKKKLLPNVIYLEDNTRLVYQKNNISKKELFDVYYIKSNSDIWHAKYLHINKSNAVGKYVDHLIRKNDFFEKDKSYLTYNFKDIKLDKNAFLFIPLENRSIFTLFKQSFSKTICLKEKNELLSYLNYKLAIPLTPILIIISLFPALITFSKNISIFYICAFAILGFVVFHTLMDSALILAENSTISPFIIIWLPIILTLFIFGKKYLKT
jgi:lipopolysaccharide export LptBFGC system permease protein LptF